MQQLLKKLFGNKKYFTRLLLPLLVMVMGTWLFILPASATGVYEMPGLTADTWILDQGDVISRFNEGNLTKTFKDLAQETGQAVKHRKVLAKDYLLNGFPPQQSKLIKCYY